jgi:hypothetical protein
MRNSGGLAARVKNLTPRNAYQERETDQKGKRKDSQKSDKPMCGKVCDETSAHDTSKLVCQQSEQPRAEACYEPAVASLQGRMFETGISFLASKTVSSVHACCPFAGFMLNPQRAPQDHSVLVKFRSLARLLLAFRTAHVGNTNAGGRCVDTADVFFNDLRLVSGGFDARRMWNERHGGGRS